MKSGSVESLRDAQEQVLAAVERLERRLERLEGSMARLTDLLDQAPGLIAATADTADGVVAHLQRRGVDLDQRLHLAVELVERLTAPETVATLQRALELASSAEGVLAAAGDTFDGAVASLARRGVDVDERLRTALQLAERVSEPQVLEALGQAAELAQSAPALVATAADTFDTFIAGLDAQGIHVDDRLQILYQVGERLSSPEALSAVRKVLDRVDKVHNLLDSGVLDQPAVEAVSTAAESIADTVRDGTRPVGMFGAWRALSEPEIQQALGVLVEFGRRFGKAVGERDGQ